MRSLEARVQKLEARASGVGSFRRRFWIFGRDADDVERRRAEGLASGQQQFETAEHIIWRGPEPVPAARWSRMSDLTPDETEDLVATVGASMGWPSQDRGGSGLYGALLGFIEALRVEVGAVDPCRSGSGHRPSEHENAA